MWQTNLIMVLVAAVAADSAVGIGPAAAAPGRTVISDVMVISMSETTPASRATVVIEGGVITEIGGPDARLWRLGDLLIRGTGLYLMPGLIDGGVATLDPAELQVLALTGATTVVVADGALPWLTPLVQRPSVGMPRLVPESQLPEGIHRTGAQRATSDREWAGPAERATPASVTDPLKLEAWRGWRGCASLPADPRPTGAPWIPASRTGEPWVGPEFSLVAELEALAATGSSIEECLRSATRGAADLLSWPTLGRIEVGAAADLLLLEADPRQDLAALRRLRAVVLRGEIIRAGRREATLSQLRALRRGHAQAIANVRQLAEGSRAWLIRFDGLPRGAVVGARCEAGLEIHFREHRSLWSPIHSQLEQSAVLAQDWSVVDGLWSLRTPSVDLDAVRTSPSGPLRLWLLPEEDAAAAAGVTLPWPPSSLRPPLVPPLRPLLREEGEAIALEGPQLAQLLVFDPWPGMAGLRQLDLAPGEQSVAFLEAFGGSVRLARWTADVAPWPSGGGDAAECGPPALRELARAVEASPWAPLRVLVVQLRPEASSLLGRDGLAEALRRLRHPQFILGAVAFDARGWPAVGRFLVPEGLWEFHPLLDPPEGAGWEGTEATEGPP
jgi:hypothetical protein